MPRSRRARSAAAVGASVRVCGCAASARLARRGQPVSRSYARNSGCAANAPFPPTQPDLTRGVAGQTSHGGDVGGASPHCTHCTARRVFFGVFSLQNATAERFPYENTPPPNDRNIGVCSSRRSSATLPGRRCSRTPRRRSWTPRLSTSCVSSRRAAAAARRRLCWECPSVPRELRTRQHSSTLEYAACGSTRLPLEYSRS